MAIVVQAGDITTVRCDANAALQYLLEISQQHYACPVSIHTDPELHELEKERQQMAAQLYTLERQSQELARYGVHEE